MSYRLFVNAKSTVLVRMFSNGLSEVATRPSADWTWGAPENLEEEWHKDRTTTREISNEQAGEILEVIGSFLNALHSVGKTMNPTAGMIENDDGSWTLPWTATDEFGQMYLRVVKLLRG